MTRSRTSRHWTARGSAAIAAFATIAALPSAPAYANAAPAAGASPGIATTKTVTNTNNSGAGSLRAAIFKVNNPALAWDTIHFNIAGAGRHVISPASDLPALTAPVTIDGYSQPGTSPATSASTASLAIVINATGLTRALELNTNNSEVTGLVLRDADTGAGNGIEVTGSSNTIAGNYIGVTVAGEAAAPNTGAGVAVNGSSNLIGGSQPADRNVISANEGPGVELQGSANIVQGNRIGTDDDGDTPLGNLGAGVLATGSSSTVSGNLIASNGGAGVDLRNDDNEVVDNEIGLSIGALGTTALPNQREGVIVRGDGTTIGAPGKSNTIGANLRSGIRLIGDDHVVASNFVGIDPAGTVGLGNGRDGILLEGLQTVIGGVATADGNVVSDNGQHGIEVIGRGGGGHHAGNGLGDVVELNLVGLDPTGVLPRPNNLNGIAIEANGVQVISNQVAFNVVNGIEVAATGVQVTTNTVWLNGDAGIEIFNGTDNPMVGNSIFDNGALGIDLFPLGVTANDMFDPDAGANDLLNFPAVVTATVNGTGTLVTWRVMDGLPNTPMQLEFFASDTCDGSGFGEATTPLGTVVMATNASGDANGTNQLSGATVAGQVVTATATVLPVTTGPTSELSACRTVM